MISTTNQSRIRFCIPDNRSPYIEIDGMRYHIGERPESDSKLATVLGHQGKEFTQRDFVLLLFLAMEAKRLGLREIELPCERIAGAPGWHSDSKQVRTGVAKRFDGTVRAHKNNVVWDPVVTCEFEDENRCRQYLQANATRSTGTPGTTESRIVYKLDELDARMKRIEAALLAILKTLQ